MLVRKMERDLVLGLSRSELGRSCERVLLKLLSLVLDSRFWTLGSDLWALVSNSGLSSLFRPVACARYHLHCC